MTNIETRVDNLEKDVAVLKNEVKGIETQQEHLFSKLFKRLDKMETLEKKKSKWIYRLLGIIIALLLIISIKSPSTASQIVSSAGAIVKAI